MYAAIRQYEMGAGSVADVMRIVNEEFADTLSREPGFVGYEVVASGSDEIGRAQGTDFFALDALLTSEERAMATRRSLRRSSASSSI
jgi:hypothetical protein